MLGFLSDRNCKITNHGVCLRIQALIAFEYLYPSIPLVVCGYYDFQQNLSDQSFLSKIFIQKQLDFELEISIT